jgi:type VI secretion system protein VasD
MLANSVNKIQVKQGENMTYPSDPTHTPRPLRRAFMGIAMASAAVALAACAAKVPPPPPPPAMINATIATTSNTNADPRGRASPIVVRVYELKSVAAFNSADFFALFEKDRDTLALDVVTRDEFTLRPGDSVPLNREAKPESRHIAVFAAYRDNTNAVWRTATPIALSQINQVSIRLEASAVRITTNAVPFPVKK